MRVMKEASLEKKLKELVEQFGTSPDPKFNKLAILAKKAHEPSITCGFA
jgi:hypothetical protein